MAIYFVTLLCTFIVIVGAGLFINFSKSRPRNGRHQLTGMCHRSGGEVCHSCADVIKKEMKGK